MIDNGVGAQRHGGAADGRTQDRRHDVGGVEQAGVIGVDDAAGENVVGRTRTAIEQAFEIDGRRRNGRILQDLALRCRQRSGQDARCPAGLPQARSIVRAKCSRIWPKE